MKLLTEARKTLVAIVAALGVATTALADGSISTPEWIAIGLAFAGALGVYQTANKTQTQFVQVGDDEEI